MHAAAVMKPTSRSVWRRVAAILGCLFVAAALAVLGWEIVLAAADGGYHMLAAGEIWFRLDAGSLNLVQAVIQRYVLPALWDGIVVVLQWPAWPLLAGIGGILLALAWLPRRR